MTSGLDTRMKPLLLPPRLRTLEEGDDRRASYSLDPVLFTALVSALLAVVVAVKRWIAQRFMRAA